MPPDLIAMEVEREPLSIVLPVFRNRQQLPELVDRLRYVLGELGAPWRIVFVDDCGSDGAREWIADRATEDARFILVENERNLGQHASIVRGLAAVSGGLAIVMDADLQDAPEDIPRLVAAWRPGLGGVFARRSRAYQPKARDWTGRQFKRLLRRLATTALPEGVGTFVLISDEARRKTLEMASERPYLPLLLARTGLPLATVEIEKGPRSDGASAYSTGRRVALATRALWLALRWRIERR